jgi:hypothetical protein
LQKKRKTQNGVRLKKTFHFGVNCGKTQKERERKETKKRVIVFLLSGLVVAWLLFYHETEGHEELNLEISILFNKGFSSGFYDIQKPRVCR